MDKRLTEILLEVRSLQPAVRERHIFERCCGDWRLYEHVMRILGTDELPPSSAQQEQQRRASEDGAFSAASGRYRAIDTLGEGSSAIVYLAQQLEPVRRRVALKVIKLGTNDTQALEKFERERQMMASVSHPGIARVYEAGATAGGRPFFAMEYVPGQPLTEYCDNMQLDVRERVRLFLSVCRAVQHAHAKGIIHRDLKPSNIIVTHTDDGETAKIIDFGVARPVGAGIDPGVVGSLNYMSPEQARPTPEGVDTRTDIYSLGATLYELMTSQCPIDVGTVTMNGYARTIARIADEVPRHASDCACECEATDPDVAHRRGLEQGKLSLCLREDIDWVLARALEKDRHHRYQTVSEFAADLERFLQGAPVLAGPRGLKYRAHSFVRHHKAIVAGTTIVLAVLLIGTVLNTAMFVRNRRAMQLARKQSEQILALSDVVRLETTVAIARDIVPAYPERIHAIEGWLENASREFGGRLSLHRERLQALRAVGHTTGEDPTYQIEVLAKLVNDLESFLDPDPVVGLVSQMKRRLQMAREIAPASTGAYAAEWEDAIRAIADSSQFPRYGGLVMTPQVGLVPLGPDSESGLMEFAHVGTGEVPKRGADGRLVVTERCGIVMVLLPGGWFWMGATRDPELARMTTGVVDPDAEGSESPPHRVHLEPFFISKFEVTQGQWLRLTGDNPSRRPPGISEREDTATLLHPVDSVDWEPADWWIRLIGMDLPTEEQWEYAARAGTLTPYWWGDDIELFPERENVLDQTALAAGTRPTTYQFAPWNDGYADVAPVGSFAPNPFGLHDMLGNIGEWTRSYWGSYRTRTPIPDIRLWGKTSFGRIARGADASGGYLSARSTLRVVNDPVGAHLGVRPVRRIEP